MDNISHIKGSKGTSSESIKSWYDLIPISENDCIQSLIWDNFRSDFGSHNKSSESKESNGRSWSKVSGDDEAGDDKSNGYDGSEEGSSQDKYTSSG